VGGFGSMSSSQAKGAAPLGLGMAAAGALAAPLFVLPRSSPPGQAPALRAHGYSKVAAAEAPARLPPAWAGVTSFGLAGAALVAAGAVRALTSRQAAAAGRRGPAAKGPPAKKGGPTKAAAAKAPVLEKKAPKRPSTPPFDPSQQVGAIAPLGYFDPLGLCKPGDKKTFRLYREAEIKHGRVAMVASIGLLMQHFVHLDIKVVEVQVKTAPTSLGAWTLFWGPVGFFGLTGLLFFAFIMENVVWIPAGAAKEPGDFGDPLGLNMYTEEMRNKEISNGRFAMIAVTGIFAAEAATGKDAIQQLGF